VTISLYAGLTLESALPLPGLPEGERSLPRGFVFRLLAEDPSATGTHIWIHDWQSTVGILPLSLARTSRGFLLRFPELADFIISADGADLGAWAAPDTNTETLQHLLLDQVLPRALAHRGALVLHAGAVQAGSRAIAFLGESGCGKSTLTASLHLAGYSLLSDDGLVLSTDRSGIQALPPYPSLRLWPDAMEEMFGGQAPAAPMAHYSSKRRMEVGALESPPVTESLPLASIYILDSSSGAAEISITRIPPAQTCVEIIRNTFQLDVTDRARAAALFRAASAVAREVPAYRLAYPRGFEHLPDVHRAVLESSG
jgi:hypothetical protein